MPKHTERFAIMFADICGSTALYDHLGDEKAQRLMTSCIAIMRDVVVEHHGVVIKTIGDEILCAFLSANAGLEAACAMQAAVQNGRYEDGHSMHIRIGFHYGEVICEDGDVFGDTVNIAARIAAQARAHQIMTSQSVVDALPESLRRKTHRIMAAEFKGKQIEYDIFLVAWVNEDEGGTHIQLRTAPTVPTMENIGELTLAYRGKTFTINKDRKKLIMGRGDNCDIVISSNLASRHHAGFELRFGKFFIVDQSTNGTYVRTSDGDISHITRQETLLQGTGLISPGQSFAEEPTELIQFSVGLIAQ